jgi:hypothetical protein
LLAAVDPVAAAGLSAMWYRVGSVVAGDAAIVLS